jgi:hypothetical protein
MNLVRISGSKFQSKSYRSWTPSTIVADEQFGSKIVHDDGFDLLDHRQATPAVEELSMTGYLGYLPDEPVFATEAELEADLTGRENRPIPSRR